MMYGYPASFPFRRFNNNYVNYNSSATYYNTNKNNPNLSLSKSKNKQATQKENIPPKHTSNTETEVFEIFGIKLYFDDILLICLIFFLYNEGVKDQYLFIALILLLLS